MKDVSMLAATTETGQPEPILSVNNLSVVLGHQQVLNNVTFQVYPGELLAILGASGSGKTTLLNAVAGFLAPSNGSIALSGDLVSQPGRLREPEKRHLGMVFQSYALWPQMTVLENVAFPLRRQGVSKAASRQQAVAMLARLGLEAYLHRHPSELSGGEQQRVGLARALAARPRLFLFDEPTANLDAALKTSFAQEIRQQQQEAQVAGLYVTHDVREAFAVADRVMILEHGQVKQLGSPLQIYECPLNQAIAGICGLYTLLPGRVEAQSDGVGTLVTIVGKQFSVTLAAPSQQSHLPADVLFLLRPEWGEIARNASPQKEGFAATVSQVVYQGAVTEYELTTLVGKIHYRALGMPTANVGEEVQWYPNRLHVLANGE